MLLTELVQHLEHIAENTPNDSTRLQLYALLSALEPGIELTKDQKLEIYQNLDNEFHCKDIETYLKNNYGYSDEMIQNLSVDWLNLAQWHYEEFLSNDDHWEYCLDQAISLANQEFGNPLEINGAN